MQFLSTEARCFQCCNLKVKFRNITVVPELRKLSNINPGTGMVNLIGSWLKLLVFGSLLNLVFSFSPVNLQVQSFKESFHNFSRKIYQAENSANGEDSFVSIKNGMNGWTVQAVSTDKNCGSAIFRTTGSRTGCLIDSESTSLRVSCNSSK